MDHRGNAASNKRSDNVSNGIEYTSASIDVDYFSVCCALSEVGAAQRTAYRYLTQSTQRRSMASGSNCVGDENGD
jgi:hypothetical protein